MNKIHFKTNINCNNCIQKVTPTLDTIEGIQNWSVDTDDAQKILTVETDTATAEEIITGIQNIGFDITKL
ncbi:MAG: heavy-metal-associated domain-containing protein [Aureispira sp.]|nr:heavy-metal-associated domain-containing protein [Aureispira sp.]